MKRPSKEEVEREIAALDSLSIAALQSRWRDLYGVPSPIKVRSGFLRRAIAYRLQELVFGGLKPATRRELRRIAAHARIHRSPSGGRRSESSATSDPASTLPPRRKTLSPGTRLLREWNGTTEIAEVLAGGLGWRGKTFKTLSAVAVAITGTKWSGPKFFGLVTTKKPVSRTVTAPASTEKARMPS